MSISAMNWPKAITPKMVNFSRELIVAGSSGAEAGVGKAGVLIGIDATACLGLLFILHASYKGDRQVRYSSDRKQETRARVLKEATKEIRTKGPHDFAVAGVMTRAGLTHGGFYAHFASKEALVAEAIGAMFDD